MIRTALVLVCLVLSATFALLYRLHVMLSPPPTVTPFAPNATSGMDPDVADDAFAGWSDEALAERERLNRPGTMGADPWYVDTFELEEGERQYALEQEALRAIGRRHPPN